MVLSFLEKFCIMKKPECKLYSSLMFKYFVVLEANTDPYTLQSKFTQAQLDDAFVNN